VNPFPLPLLSGTLRRRYRRFLAEVRLADGRLETVHCANPGAMTSCAEPGRPVLLSEGGRPGRKLRYTWEMIRMGRTWVGVNTAVANRAVGQWIAEGRLFPGEGPLRREPRVGRGRLDFALGERRFVEVKSASLRVGAVAAFPDAPTERGARHLRALARLRKRGFEASLVFFVARSDAEAVRPADEIDPAYGRALRAAARAGVTILAVGARFHPRGVEWRGFLPVLL
jgi:sugar fermentation stimulation protein A